MLQLQKILHTKEHSLLKAQFATVAANATTMQESAGLHRAHQMICEEAKPSAVQTDSAGETDTCLSSVFYMQQCSQAK